LPFLYKWTLKYLNESIIMYIIQICLSVGP
jgi:hypothetical protein